MSSSMSNPLRMLARLGVAVSIGLAPASGFAEARYGLSDEVSAVFSRWLRSTCIGDEERALSESLLRYRSALAPAFEKAIVDGPPEDERSIARAAAEARYAERAKFPIEDYLIEGVSKEQLARFKRVSGEQYIDDQVRRFAAGYRSNAVAGLGIVGGTTARALLARIVVNKDDPLALAAAEALKAMRRR